jgi:colanic acid/amylovoran biosynthesis glycosyltransferase
LSDELRNRIEDAGLSKNVRMLGAMDREAALKEVQRHWVFCQHSVTAKSGDQEGFALSPAEAALLEIPVVSTIHNGIPEHVLDGKTGYLVPEFDFVRMAERMVWLVESEEQRRQFGQAGRRNIMSLCSATKRKKEIEDLLHRASFASA